MVDVQSLRTAGLRLGGTPLPLVGRASIYTCGITPYDVTHLGHASTFVWSDLVARVIHATGVEVASCRNVTDVDDVLTAAAGARGRDTSEFALYQEYLFDMDMTSLRVARPSYGPRPGTTSSRSSSSPPHCSPEITRTPGRDTSSSAARRLPPSPA